jgi:peptide/nickel transport system substrate-binding protein
MVIARVRKTLYALALAATVAAVPARGGEYRQSPVLDPLTESGALPPVGERLPERPVVVRPVHRVGKYGGTWRALAAGARDLMLTQRMGYETLMRWDRDAQSVIPGVAESVDVRDDARTFVFKLRKGMRWSDGAPFTSADFVYQRQYVMGNKVLTPAIPSFWTMDGKPFDVEAPDPYTVVIRFGKPYGLFLETLAFTGRQGELFAPAHYGKQFHPDFIGPEEATKKAAAAGYNDWGAYYTNLHDLDRTPGCPSLAPFIVKIAYPAQRCLAVRNPYYWKVDPAGNQLPYIDEVGYDRVLDLTMLNLRALDGRVDFQNRGIDAGNFTLLTEAGKTKGYRVQADLATGTTGVYVNQFSRSETARPVLQDRRFRVALSVALNRPELIEFIYNGLGVADNGVSMEADPYFVPGVEKTYVRYDPAEANRLLDELGMTRGADGMRRWPDGKPFREIVHVFPAENGTNADLWQLVADYWREVGLQFSVVMEDAALSRLQVMNGNSDFFAYRSLSQHWALDGSFKIPTANYSYHAPLYGKYVQTQGRQGEKPSPDQQRLVDWYEEMRATPDAKRRLALGRNILDQWSKELYFVGICRPVELTVISDRFHNVPGRIQYNYRLMSPGYMGIEQFYIDPAEKADAGTADEAPVPYLFDPTNSEGRKEK